MTFRPLPGTLCTGDVPSAPQGRFSFSAPSDVWVQEIIYGLFVYYNSPLYWDQCGTMTPDQAAELFTEIANSVSLISYVGTIIAFAGLAPPANTLICDGASYLRSDYPFLFATIGVLWGSVDATHFNVPDLRGRVLVGAGTGPGLSPRTITDIGGEEDHQLTIAQMPSHAHTVTGAAPNATTVGPGAPQPTAVPAFGLTSMQGGDGAHNNMQPFAVVNYAIIAK